MKSSFEIILLQTKTNPMNIIHQSSIPLLYRIVGLNVTTCQGHTYETILGSIKIEHDKTTGKGITKNHEFITYIVYILFENAYYAIHLSESHCASFGGRLCTLGNMSITNSNYEEVMSNSTCFPLTPIDIKGFKLNEYYEDDVFVHLYNDPDTCVFKFSRDGNDERTPSGYVYVNTELFKNNER